MQLKLKDLKKTKNITFHFILALKLAEAWKCGFGLLQQMIMWCKCLLGRLVAYKWFCDGPKLDICCTYTLFF